MNLNPKPDRSNLDQLIAAAIAYEKTLTPLQRAINSMEQKMSWVVAESMMNDDASSNGRTREEALALLEKVAPEFIIYGELKRRMIASGEWP